MSVRCSAWICAVAFCGGAAAAQDLIAKTDPLPPADEARKFRLPAGFEAQLVAAEPDIQKPLNLAFDARGRLWVSDTVEYPFPAPAGRKARDTVKILSDLAPDGRARQITTFADDLNIPIGLLPLGGGDRALVFSIPNIWHITAQGKREILLGPFGWGDTHGLTNAFRLGLDGWVYASHGYANDSALHAADGSRVTMNSGNVYRFRPDGSRVELFSRGQVNPFGLAFDAQGNLYSADCHSKPITLLLRGAVYPSFGKPHDGLGFAPEICAHDHGSTGIAGVALYLAEQFPPEYRDTAFLGNVLTNRINHDRLVPRGSAVRAEELPDFLLSDDPWFRPVDIVLGPDGALYVADFYNRIIGHYEVPLDHPQRDRHRGRIWRIVYRGADGKLPLPAPPRDFTKAGVRELLRDLADPNLAVRTLATHQLVERGAPAVGPVRALLTPRSRPLARAHALWVLQRLGVLEEKTLAAAAQDPDPIVRVHALRVIAERKPEGKNSWNASILAAAKDPDPAVRRVAAEALGVHVAAEHARPLLDLLAASADADAHLRHTARIALRNQFLDPNTWAALGDLWLESEKDARAVADVMVGVPRTEAAVFLLKYLLRYEEPPRNWERFARHIARYGEEQTLEALIALAREKFAHSFDPQAELLRAVRDGRDQRGAALGNAAAAWAESLAETGLRSAARARRVAAMDLIGQLRLGKFESKLAERLGMADADAAARALAALNTPSARAALAAALASAAQREQETLALALAGSRAGAEKLLEEVSAGRASARLLQSPALLERLKAAGVRNLDAQLARLTAQLPPADESAQRLLEIRRAEWPRAKTDAARGATVFERHCSSCHSIGGAGAGYAPQLDGIGARGAERLLEDILDPNRNVDPMFRTTILKLRDGRALYGLLLREEGEVVVLLDDERREARLQRGEIAERMQSLLSPMPANFGEQLTAQELFDLTAFLLAPPPPQD